MTKHIMVIPVFGNVGLTAVSLGLVHLLQSMNIDTGYFQPIMQEHEGTIDDYKHAIDKHLVHDVCIPIQIEEVEHLLSRGQIGELLLLEEIIAQYHKCQQAYEVIVIKGLAIVPDQPYITYLNVVIAEALNANVVLVAKPDHVTSSTLSDQVIIAKNAFTSVAPLNVSGCIINRASSQVEFDQCSQVFQGSTSHGINLLGCIAELENIQEVATVKNSIAQHIKKDWIKQLMAEPEKTYLTPPFFYYQMVEKARASKKRIILSESEDIRVLKAASICAKRHIANIVLLGKRSDIISLAKQHGIELDNDIEIIDPDEVIDRYIEPLVQLRQHKGMTIESAKEYLKNPVALATMMLHLNEVDGLVAGSLQTTANTIRPALQLIKSAPGSSLISSAFFMCLPEHVLVYADCALNPNPTAEELAEIAIQSAESAKSVGMHPKVAMMSYSSGHSGKGPEVEKVKEATKIAQTKRPDLEIDGPLQYDASINKTIGQLKAPNSKIAGEANVFIFPDLDAGNIAYKVLQQSTKVPCIGPFLQGIRKPVSDLSRGCSSEDIVFTVALIAAQAGV